MLRGEHWNLLPLQKDGRDTWLTMSIWGPTDIRGDLVALGPQPIAFALPAPAAKAEKPDPAKGEFSGTACAPRFQVPRSLANTSLLRRRSPPVGPPSP